MWMELWDEEQQRKLADIKMNCLPDTFLIQEVEVQDVKGISFDKAYEILEGNVSRYSTYEEDKEILAFLRLSHNALLFGRVREEAPILEALLRYFKREESPYALYPKDVEVLCFSIFMEKYDQIYLLYPRGYQEKRIKERVQNEG